MCLERGFDELYLESLTDALFDKANFTLHTLRIEQHTTPHYEDEVLEKLKNNLPGKYHPVLGFAVLLTATFGLTDLYNFGPFTAGTAATFLGALATTASKIRSWLYVQDARLHRMI